MLAHNIINGEIRTVLYSLRQNARWSDEYGINSVNEGDRNIYRKFSDLRNKITEKYIDPTTMDAEILLAPFIDTLRSPNLTGSIVDSILLAIDQFLRVGVITIKSPNASKAMSNMIEAVAKCRFETSDISQDEVVLVHMLDLFRSSVILPIGKVLSDNDIWKIFDTVFNSSQEPNYSPVLRRIAERVLTDMTCLIFKQLYKNVLTTEYEKDNEGTPKSPTAPVAQKTKTPNEHITSPSHDMNLNLEEKEYLTPVNEEQIVFADHEYSYVTIAARVLTFLTTRINPNAVGAGLSEEAANNSVLLCIKLMRLAIETAGTTITHTPEILHLISDDIFEHLIKLIQRSTTSYDIATECMRIFTVISTVLRSRMKLQQEVFFQKVIIWGLKNNRNNVKFEELILDTLIDITADPSFLIDLYVNYDCDSQRQDLLEQLYMAISLFTLVFSCFSFIFYLNETVKDNVLSSAVITRLALRIIYAGIKHINYRCNELQHPTTIADPLISDTRTHHESATVLWQKKLKKKTLFKGASIFNTDPKLGIRYLQEAGVIPNPATAKDIAHILRFTPGLDKPTIGQYIGKNNDFNIEVLSEYVKTFNFKGVSILTALRMFLEAFRLPGEAQQIDRIMETFARYAYQQTSDSQYLINPDVT